MILCNIYSF